MADRRHDKNDPRADIGDAFDDDANVAELPISKRGWLNRVYDEIFPPKPNHEYTEDQDYHHATIVFVIVFALVVAAVVSIWVVVANHMSYRSDHIFIPASTFTTDQVKSIGNDLDGQGFVDVSYESGLGIRAYGTPTMCDEWRSSFYEKNVSDAIAKIDGSLVSYGIIWMQPSDGYDTLTIQTVTNDPSVEVIGYMTVTNETVKEIIDGVAAWCAVLHDGQKLHISFVNQDGNEYLSEDVSNASMIVFMLEDDDRASSNGDASNANEETGNIIKNGNTNVTTNDTDGSNANVTNG